MADSVVKSTVIVKVDGSTIGKYSLNNTEATNFANHVESFFTSEKQSILRLMYFVTNEYGINIDDLKVKYSKSSHVAEAKKLVIYIVIKDLGFNPKEVRQTLGITSTHIKDAVETIEVRLRHYKDLKLKYQKIIELL